MATQKTVSYVVPFSHRKWCERKWRHSRLPFGTHKSSLTLFHCIANEQSVFITILETFENTKEEFFPDDFEHNVVGTRALLGTDAV